MGTDWHAWAFRLTVYVCPKTFNIAAPEPEQSTGYVDTCDSDPCENHSFRLDKASNWNFQ